LLKDRVAAIVARVEPTTVAAPSPSEQAADAEHQPEEVTRNPTKLAPRRKRETKVQIKTRVSQSEAEEMERLTRTLSSYLGAKVNASQVTRALWTLAICSQEEFAAVIDRRDRLERPSTGDPLGMAQFEDAVADLLLLAMKRTRG